MSDSLIIVNSPFQAMCAIEAIKYYHHENVDFVLFDKPVIREMTAPLICNLGAVLYINHNDDGVFRLKKKIDKVIKKKYKRIFIGDYFSLDQYLVAISAAQYHSSFIYLDDGNSTLDLIAPVPRVRHNSSNERICYFVLDKIARVKKICSHFFTIYDLGKDFPYDYVQNNFSSFIGQSIGTQPKGVYIIGTNSGAIEMLGCTYSDYLMELSNYLQDKFKGAPVFYCPHRKDPYDYTNIVYKLGWHMFDTKISVEVDFLNGKIYPEFVIGFGSTALLTLKKIYPKSKVVTIKFICKDDFINNSYAEIESYYEKSGISTLKILQ